MEVELDDNTYEKIKSLAKLGDESQGKKHYQEALDFYCAALALVPEPKLSWDASTWLYVALGETYFLMKNYFDMEKMFLLALKCPASEDNPFIHLRLGQAYYETGKMRQAKQELLLANNLDKTHGVFNGENGKYRELLDKN